MIDLILIIFVLAVFYAGFWCGKTFETVGGMFDRAKNWIKEMLS